MSHADDTVTEVTSAGKKLFPALALLYAATACALLLNNAGLLPGIGTACGESCGKTELLGFPLEVFGLALMAAVFCAWLGWRQRPTQSSATAAGSLALIHAGASLALAATQWAGIVEICALCQIAALFSILAAAVVLRGCAKGIPVPVLVSIQSVSVGALAVMALWPVLKPIDMGVEPIARVLAPQPTTPDKGDTILARALDATTIGSPDAPYELVILSDFTCPVCQRFETRVLPKLMDESVKQGNLRIRFVFGAHRQSQLETLNTLTVATSGALAGVPFEEVLAALRGANLVSVPQGINLLKAQATEDPMGFVREVAEGPGWSRVLLEHEAIEKAVRQRFFIGKSGTPAFLMIRGRLDVNNLPSAEDSYTFYGYQIEKPFLEFMGQPAPES